MVSPDDGKLREWRFETLEDRLALSFQPIADFWYDTSTFQADTDETVDVGPLAISEGHGWTDIATARQQYGLRGSGQTVAVIDSGIAYDHVALGGGLGSSYKVVGGWDFAESDANPYDDAPAGFHGTHVAGIIGATDSRYAGVVPDVDLVALRVFNDQGGGYFSWVEQALSWVHDNRNRFDSPITTVNLSLGTEWNSTTLPKWATLENELKQLAADGIFVSVAAGNSFLTYGSAGLSYPAVSPNASAVASVDATGNLSRFSQRANNVLAAPGERVMSTVPDAFYGGDGVKNDWGAASGTSMAAPYVAGASVLVREALHKAGHSVVTGAQVNELMHRTADVGVDSATGITYHRVNVGRALSSIMTATDDTVTIRGDTATVLGTTGSDTFAWNADSRELTVNGTQYSLATVAKVTINGAGGEDVLTIHGSSARETVSLYAGSGEFTSGSFRLTASSVENLHFYGDRSDQALLYDSVGNDVLEASPQGGRLSGSGYRNETWGVGSLTIISQGSGTDTANLQDSAGADELDASARFTWLRGTGYSVRVERFDRVVVNSTLGTGDVARLYGTEGSDALAIWSNQRTFYSAGVVVQTFGFRFVAFDGGGGQDRVEYHSSSRPGYLYARSNYGAIVDKAYETQFFGVEAVLANVRSSHKLKTDLAALEFYFQRIGRK